MTDQAFKRGVLAIVASTALVFVATTLSCGVPALVCAYAAGILFHIGWTSE